LLPCEPAAVECRGETVGASSLSEAQAAAGRGRIPAAHRTALGAELRGVGVWGAVCTLQVTINCAERGLLLLRVRDEIRMTIAAYQTLCVPFRREHLNVVKKYFLEPLLMMQLCGGRCYSARCMAVALAACTCCADAIQWRVVLMVFSEVYSSRAG
jgi:hypothetical protein